VYQHLEYLPFGETFVEESSNTWRTPYKFSGKELDEETGLYYYGARYYDAMRSVWLSVDPLANKYPALSPYAYVENNPLNMTDPTGMSGEPVIDKKNKTITVYSKIIFYSSSSSMNVLTAMSIANKTERQYNAANGTVKIDGTTYKVKFKITGDYRNETFDNIKSEIESNKDIKNNYFRVEATNSSETSYTDAIGANTGFFVSDQILDANSTTVSHEYGHTLGLPHEKNADGSYKVIHGQTGIMVTQNNDVDPPYQENKVRKGFFSPLTDRDKRKVTQSDIDNLHLEQLKFDKNGKAKLGKLTNTYHTTKD
jgi:RHS repeat-associated protein